jgi:hypothetical protein
MAATEPTGNGRELFADDTLVEALRGGAARRLHHPTAREIILRPEHPWEDAPGAALSYITVLQDGETYRLYYKGPMMRDVPGEDEEAFGLADIIICYAESRDGIHWEKPDLGLHRFGGEPGGNIVHKGIGSHGFSPFLDTRPDCPPEQRYKAFGTSKTDVEPRPGGTKHLFLLASPDGLRWSPLAGPKAHGAVLDQEDGDFDSQNTGFWDAAAGCYRLYFRARREVTGRPELANREDGEGYHDVKARVRDIKTATSPDGLHWSEPQFLSYPGAPDEELYTNQIIPYPRAPHLLVGFPTRYVEGRGPLTAWHAEKAGEAPGRTFNSYSDGLFMISRDGTTFRRYGEAFLRPGMPEERLWGYGACYQCLGLVETPPPVAGGPAEYSLYACEGYRTAAPVIRRHTLRLDGFVSVHAPLTGGEVLTRPLTVAGGSLRLNLATSAAGGARVEVQTAAGEPVDGLALTDCRPLFGNGVEKEVAWESAARLADLAGTAVRLRIELADADLYALHFA